MHLPARKLREKIDLGRPVLGTMLLEFSGPAVVSVTADAGLDFVVVDGEHGNQNPREIESTIEAGYQAGLATIIRPPYVDRGIFTRSLDAGAAGVLVPFCSTMKDVEDAVRATKYTPVGSRGSHLFRGHTRHRQTDPAEFMAEANRDLLTLIQIELCEALELVDRIAATEGVDGLYIGPADLSVDMGIPGQWTDPRVLDAIRVTAEACQKHGKIMGCHFGDLKQLPLLSGMGVQMLGFECDLSIYRSAVIEMVGEFRDTFSAEQE